MDPSLHGDTDVDRNWARRFFEMETRKLRAVRPVRPTPALRGPRRKREELEPLSPSLLRPDPNPKR